MSNEMAEPNNAALLDARRRATGESSKLLDSIIQGTNCEDIVPEEIRSPYNAYHSYQQSTVMKSTDCEKGS